MSAPDVILVSERIYPMSSAVQTSLSGGIAIADGLIQTIVPRDASG